VRAVVHLDGATRVALRAFGPGLAVFDDCGRVLSLDRETLRVSRSLRI